MLRILKGWSSALLTLASAFVLAACATVVPPGEEPKGETLAGRIAINVAAAPDGTPARSVSAVFELQGDPRVGRLNLSTPLGSILAQARWSPGLAVLKTPQGERQFADLDSVTREALGESLPLAALFDWLRGRPWAGAPSVPLVPPAAVGFEQMGWTVDLSRFEQGAVSASRSRAPAVTVRAKLDAS